MISLNKQSISTETIETLKNKVFEVFGKGITTHTDCLFLSDSIYNKTGRNIGITTLRRVFGLDAANNFPSAYTLDTLSIYCGQDSWNEFLSRKNIRFSVDYDSLDINDHSNWDRIKHASYQVSQHSLKSLHSKSGLPYNCTIARDWSIDFVESFINSPYSATAFVGPGGSGKSIMLTHIINEFWFSDTPKYPDDIVLFIDAQMISGLMSYGFDFSKWITAQLGFDPNSNYRKIFSSKKCQPKGRMILIIDSMDSVTERAGKLNDIFNIIISLIALNDETPWFKVILAMRNHTWHKFISVQNDYPIIQNQWYGVNFRIYNTVFSNVENLFKNEIHTIVKKFCKNLTPALSELVMNRISDNNIISFLSFPKYLQIFLNLIKENNNLPSEVDVMLRFVSKKVYNGSYANEKQDIINQILIQTNYGINGASVIRKNLLNHVLINDAFKAYNELVALGILYEEFHYNKYGTLTTIVKFGIDDIFEFLIAMHFYNNMFNEAENGVGFIMENYKTESLRESLLKWLKVIHLHYSNEKKQLLNMVNN